ncbi:MAG TPA: lysophospholipid acyltransferase family protein [Candidatus Binatia bacterium]
MRWIKLISVLSLWLFFFALLIVVQLCISVLRVPNRWKIISRWMQGFTRSMRAILNIKVTMEGAAPELARGPYVIISRHFGYLDGIVLGSLFPVIFVSKREVKSWPVVGWWTTLCGTVFINRQRKGLIPLAVNEISRKLKQGANILLFPEGAATNGERMLPFQTAPLAAPLRSRAIIVPVTLRYESIEGKRISASNRDLLYCYGDMDFFPHFWKLLALRQVNVRVTIQPTIDCSRYEENSAGRKKLADDCYNLVSGRMSQKKLRA